MTYKDIPDSCLDLKELNLTYQEAKDVTLSLCFRFYEEQLQGRKVFIKRNGKAQSVQVSNLNTKWADMIVKINNIMKKRKLPISKFFIRESFETTNAKLYIKNDRIAKRPKGRPKKGTSYV